MKFENVRTYGWEAALRGMRNPKNSWSLCDSYFGYEWNNRDAILDYTNGQDFAITHTNGEIAEFVSIGPKDMKLAKALIHGGSEHRKFLRQIMVSVDITAPLYWWKEFDTYKVGTVANSTSTMHKMAEKPITIDCFEIDDYNPAIKDNKNIYATDVHKEISGYIDFLEHLRKWHLSYLELAKNAHDSESAEFYNKLAKDYWKELIRWLPESWLQTRTVTMNYENLLGMCSRGQRRFHKLNEWSGKDNPQLINFISFARELPYAEDFIFFDIAENETE